MMTMLSRRLGVLDVHAGIVSRGGRGVLIVGGRGRGKSTTSIDGLYGGLDYLGDDLSRHRPRARTASRASVFMLPPE